MRSIDTEAEAKQKRAAIEAEVVFGEMDKRGRAQMNAGVTSDELGGVARKGV